MVENTAKRQRRTAVWYITALIITLCTIYPFLWMVSTSFKPMVDIYARPLNLIPRGANIENYQQVLETVPFSLYFRNSLLLAVSGVLTNVFLGALAGYGFAKIRFTGRKVLFGILLSSMMIPGIVTMVPQFVVLRKFPFVGGNDRQGAGGTGFINSFMAIILPGAVGTYAVFFMKQFFETLPDDLAEAARIDGCSELRIFWNVYLPLITPAAITLGIMTFQAGWNDHCGGGIAWRKMQLDYKNTPANAPAAILAFRLYLRFGDEDDLHWGEKIARWQMENLVDKDTHYVHDGMNRQGDGKIDVSWQFTYNQGVVIGILVEQYRITRDRAYLETALQVAKDSRQRFFGQHGGAMPYEGEDDVGLFRSIFFRYLDQLSIELPEQGWLAELPVINATMIVERGMDEKGRIGSSWIMHPGEKIDLAQQACGVTVLEMAVHATEQLDK